MKHIALDIGTVWTGVAISDASRLVARPFKTVATKELTQFLSHLFASDTITVVVVGHPLTMKGTQSAQTKITLRIKESLEKKFPSHVFVLFDERLSSVWAAKAVPVKNKHQKLQSHARAAAVILQGYLAHVSETILTAEQEID